LFNLTSPAKSRKNRRAWRPRPTSQWEKPAIPVEQRFDEAIRRIDAANEEDPRTEIVDGRPRPREWAFAVRVYEWVRQLAKEPSEELLLAARAHTLRRWLIPRDRYPKTTVGYHQWRDALAQFHAQEAESILREVGYPPEKVRTVKTLITRENWPANKDACVLEDADCLAFLESKLAGYLDEWGDTRTVRILRRTIRKMTPEGQAQALKLNLGERERALLLQAAGSGTAGN